MNFPIFFSLFQSLKCSCTLDPCFLRVENFIILQERQKKKQVKGGKYGNKIHTNLIWVCFHHLSDSFVHIHYFHAWKVLPLTHFSNNFLRPPNWSLSDWSFFSICCFTLQNFQTIRLLFQSDKKNVSENGNEDLGCDFFLVVVVESQSWVISARSALVKTTAAIGVPLQRF